MQEWVAQDVSICIHIQYCQRANQSPGKKRLKIWVKPVSGLFVQISKSISEEIEKQEGDEPPKKPTQFLEDDEGLEVGLYNHADLSTNVSEV
jgi:hypothetical protein